MTGDLRERAHELMRVELAEAAFMAMVERGYDTLTADDLARHLGVSRATFFRYLGSKDYVIVKALLGPVDQFAAALRASDPASAPTLWQWLRTAFESAITLAEADPARQRQRMRLVQSLPAVGARLLRARVPQVEDLAAALVEAGTPEPAAQVLAAGSVAVLDRCWTQWLEHEGASLRRILDDAFAALDAAHLPPSGSVDDGAR